MTIQIKICGLSTPETLETAIEAGATHVGLVHFPPSPRHIELDRAVELRRLAHGRARVVLLLANADIQTTAKAIDAIKPDAIQFHGSETPEWTDLVRTQLKLEVWKALGVRDRKTLAKSARFHGKVDRLLFDAPAKALPGGTGTSFDWSMLAGHDHRLPWALAGGLAPDNVVEAIAQTGAKMVDTSSGVESAPGVKDIARIRAFCKAVLAA